jgi:alkylhydroperoxidase family enzyme
LARRLGGTDEQVAALARADYASFPPEWQAVFRYADALTPAAARVSDDTFAELAKHWSDSQVIEITAVITLFNYFNRFANALEVPPTK